MKFDVFVTALGSFSDLQPNFTGANREAEVVRPARMMELPGSGWV